MQDRKRHLSQTSLFIPKTNDLSILSGNTSDQRTLQLKEAGENFGET